MQCSFPPEPRELTISVLISEPGAQPHCLMTALIDTGATMCVIRPDLASLLSLPLTTKSASVTLADSSQTGSCPVVECQVLVDNVGPIPILAVVFPVGNEFILGMNWCNQVNSSFIYTPNTGRLLSIDPL